MIYDKNNVKSKGLAYYKHVNVTNNKFGLLTILGEGEWRGRNNKAKHFACICDCGEMRYVECTKLIKGEVKSCGCIKGSLISSKNKSNLIGQTFGLLYVVEISGRTSNRTIVWNCLCNGCNKHFNIPTHNLSKKNGSKSCNKCFIKRGPEHHSWKNDKSNEDREYERNLDSVKYKEWYTSVRSRDGYRCIICNNSGRIASHHLNGWNWCKEQRYDVNNGITLCCSIKNKNYVGCHNLFHSQYGKGNNTKEQFIEFFYSKTGKYLDEEKV